MECLLFSDLRIFWLSSSLCEWLTSTPFLLLVYYIYVYMYICIYLTDIPRQREEYEVIYGTRRNAECHITSILRAGVEYLFYYTPNSQS